ncbi:MAG: SURF1 family protein [Alphaproteobacteria bacterium]|nr:SURF1 family protein [Alphaproteobacteria bacterium]
MRRPPLFATLLTVAGVIVLCALGTWQLQRLEWKTKILDHLGAEYAKDAASIAIAPADLEQNFDFRRGTLHGTYEFDKQIMIGPRRHDNLPGYHVITPYRLEDGSHILVNRGWVPEDWKFFDEKNPPQRPATGLLRRPDPGNPFTPDNDPAKDQWYHLVPAEIAAAKGIENIYSYVLYREPADAADSNYPLAEATKPEIDNNHLQYAIFWFTMAGVLVVIYILRFMKKN